MATVYRKYPDEIIRITLYYGYDMSAGDAISSVTAQVAGEDDQALTCTLNHRATTVILVASAGTPEGIYQVYVEATTTGGLKLMQQVEVAVGKGVSNAFV
jgi:hypothetical protein